MRLGRRFGGILDFFLHFNQISVKRLSLKLIKSHLEINLLRAHVSDVQIFVRKEPMNFRKVVMGENTSFFKSNPVLSLMDQRVFGNGGIHCSAGADVANKVSTDLLKRPALVNEVSDHCLSECVDSDGMLKLPSRHHVV